MKQPKRSYSKCIIIAVISIVFVCSSVLVNMISLHDMIIGENADEIFKQEGILSAGTVLVYCGFVIYILYSRWNNDRELEKIAFYDPVTGISNSYKFEMDAAKTLKKNPSPKYAILIFDVDKFTVINDVYGHQTGDFLLCHVAQALVNILGDTGFCARFVADSFLVFMRCSKNEDEDIENFIDRFTREAHQLCSKDILEKPAFSFGIYKVTDRTISVRKMIDRANLAQETVKNSHGNNCAVFDETMRSEMLKNKEIEDRMEEALGQNQFVVYYQPKYRLEDNTICGAEALVRWLSPQYGLIPPNEFIPIFERDCFIIDLDLYVLEQVCKQLRVWLDKGLYPVPVSINISRIHLCRPDFIEGICQPLIKYEISPALIELELTESAIVDNIAGAGKLMEQLHQIGFRLSMDDFGTGYSSLNTLKCLELDVLKLDRGFFLVSDSEEQRRSEIIVNNMITMAKELKILTVAEGIEAKEQAEFLKKAGCDAIQGFYFARPVPVGDYEKLAFEGKY